VDALFDGGAVTRPAASSPARCCRIGHSPDGVRDDTVQSLRDTEDLIRRWHGRGRLGYAITPRFAPTSSDDAVARRRCALAAKYGDVWIQSHVAENRDEVRLGAQSCFRSRAPTLGVYERFRSACANARSMPTASTSTTHDRMP
jgi:guanine deaminase